MTIHSCRMCNLSPTQANRGRKTIRFWLSWGAAVLLFLVSLNMMSVVSAHAAQITTNWISSSDGSWTDPQNWDNGVPDNSGGNTYIAVIDYGGSYTVFLDSAVSVDQCMLNSSTATLNITPGRLLEITGSSPRIDLSMGVLNNEGLIKVHDGGTFAVGDEAELRGDVVLINSRLEALWDGSGPAVGPATFTFKGSCTMEGEIPNGWSLVILGSDDIGDASLTMAASLVNYGAAVLDPGEGDHEVTLSAPLGLFANKTTGVLGGTGTVIADIENEGSIAPGMSAGLLDIIGNLTFLPSGTFDVELGGLLEGEEFDKLAITGTLSLDGTLNISVLDGFLAGYGDTFRIATANPREETFPNIAGAYAPDDRFFEVLYDDTSVYLLAHELAPASVGDEPGGSDDDLPGDEIADSGDDDIDDEEENQDPVTPDDGSRLSSLPTIVRLFCQRQECGGMALVLEMPQAGSIELDVFDLSGRRLESLERSYSTAGVRIFRIDNLLDRGCRLVSGIYFARVTVNTAKGKTIRTTRIPILR